MGLDRQPTKALQHALDDLRDRVTALLRTGKPVVLLEESGGENLERILPLGSTNPLFAWLPMSHTEAAGRDMGTYLRELGHRRLAWFGDNDGIAWSSLRCNGLRQAFEVVGIRDAVIPFNVRLGAPEEHDTAPSHDTAQGAFRGFSLSRYPLRSVKQAFDQAITHPDITAWVCAHDRLALTALDYLTERGLDVGSRLSLAEFDDTPDAMLAGLTSYSFAEDRIVTAAINHILSPSRPKPRHMIEVPGMVMARQSTGRAAESGR